MSNRWNIRSYRLYLNVSISLPGSGVCKFMKFLEKVDLNYMYEIVDRLSVPLLRLIGLL